DHDRLAADRPIAGLVERDRHPDEIVHGEVGIVRVRGDLDFPSLARQVGIFDSMHLVDGRRTHLCFRPFLCSGNRSPAGACSAIVIASWPAWTFLPGELAPRFALQTGASLFVRLQGSRSMPAVLALKRNSSTVRYCFEADAEPAVLPRALELLAKRGLVPARVFAQADADLLSVEIEVEGLEPTTADHVGRCLGQIVGVRQTF